MAFQANVLQVLIASPSDVFKQRNEIEESIYKWNNLHAKQMNTILLPIRWENDTIPSYNEEGSQQSINEQIVYDCDILVGVFWTKFGTATATSPSGTIEEINIFLKQGKEVMLYFVDGDIPRNSNYEEVKKIDDFKSEYRKKGITFSYSKGNIIPHLYKKVQEYNKKRPSIAKSLFQQDFNNAATEDIDIYTMVIRGIFTPVEMLFLSYMLSTNIREFDSLEASTLNTEHELIAWLESNSYDSELINMYGQVLSNFYDRGLLTPTYHPSYNHVITYKMPLPLYDRVRALTSTAKLIISNNAQKFYKLPF
ncbi:hypothetical protein [Planococcus halocryophilus]|uniref:hypothetical protein n=1 Tax=Planococcus halocryophilus TaxID=1215089 RepID=UPI001F0E19AF|nr:hypothetical protein [Planococcus halocryophilus]MCH4825599.1 hypothetical protein [Planococcus halocryophilus]